MLTTVESGDVKLVHVVCSFPLPSCQNCEGKDGFSRQQNLVE